MLKMEFTEVEYVTRFLSADYTLKYEENIFTEKITFADPDFLKMFSFNLTRGNPHEAFRDKNTIILGEHISRKYFGQDNPVGERITLIRFGVSHVFTITGIIESPPDNSSIQFDILIPFEKLRDFLGDDYLSNWGVASVKTYVQLFESSQNMALTLKYPTLIKKYTGEIRTTYNLQPFSDVHFAASVHETMVPSSSMVYSYILGGITLLILLIAGFNSMNFSTALASTRYKEIGVRKVMGAVRRQIIFQFCGETVFLSFFAFVLGILLAELFLPTFNILAEKTLKIDYFENWFSLILAVVFMSVIGLLSGIFPSVMISTYPTTDLYQRQPMFSGRSSFSRSSIMIQFG
jgi:putative ABC transport system permease protein